SRLSTKFIKRAHQTWFQPVGFVPIQRRASLTSWEELLSRSAFFDLPAVDVCVTPRLAVEILVTAAFAGFPAVCRERAGEFLSSAGLLVLPVADAVRMLTESETVRTKMPRNANALRRIGRHSVLQPSPHLS